MKEEEKRSFWEKWRYKYRFVILNSDTFEERLVFKLSRLNVFVLGSFALLFLIGGTTLLIALTPLREYIPGYTSTNMRRQVVELNHQSDSLMLALEHKERYLLNIRNIIEGKLPHAEGLDNQESTPNLDIHFEKSIEDSLLREQIETEERFSLISSAASKQQSIKNLLFFSPIKGVVTQKFKPQEKHFGVDIVAQKNEAIKATLDGVVVFSSWTSETGHVIALLHDNNLFSIYKHNSVLLKKEGARVRAGEAIAIIGNSGEFTTGPHLHFELWYNNSPVDPEQYLIF
jgi:murein DD-endopeptidase MepM/ murein hydrolase activator NlpD